jgi:hypothetical protein
VIGCVLASLLAPAAAEDPPTQGPVAVSPPPAPGGTPTVVLDGVEVATVVRPLGDADGPAPDDLVRVGAFWVRRDASRLVFRSGPGRLYRIAEDGRERLVASPSSARPSARRSRAACGSATRAVRARARGRHVWRRARRRPRRPRVRPRRAADRRRSRGSRASTSRAVFVDAGAADDPVPTLPEGRRAPRASATPRGKGPRELVGRGTCGSCRSRSARARTRPPIHPLRGLVALRSLDLGGRDVAHLRALARLTALRTLDAAGCIVLDDLRPLAGPPRSTPSMSPSPRSKTGRSPAPRRCAR